MFYCKYCGRQLNDGAQFCDKCGNKIEAQAEEISPVKAGATAVKEETPDIETSKHEAETKTGILSDVADKIGYKALYVLMGIFSIASAAIFLLTIGWGFLIFLDVLAAGICIFLWARKEFEKIALYAIPIILFSLRSIVLDIVMAATGVRFVFPPLGIIIQLLIIAVLVLYVLRMFNVLNRKKGSPAICILLFVQMLFVFLEYVVNVGSSHHMYIPDAAGSVVRHDRFMAFLAMTGWVLYLLAHVVLELLSAVNIREKEEYSEPIVADQDKQKELLSRIYAKDTTKPEKPEVKVFIPESFVREEEARRAREKEKEERIAAEKAAEAQNRAKVNESAGAQNVESSPESVSFVDLDEVIIDEKISAFKFTNAYKIYNATGNQVGAIEQINQVSGGAMAAQILFGNKMKSVQAFEFDLVDNDGKRIANLKRGGVGGGLSAVRTMSVSDVDGSALGTVQVIPHAWLPSFDIRDNRDSLICSIESDWKGYVYTLKSPSGSELGMINKKWTGLAREYFTSADKYQVKLNDDLRGKNRLLVFTASVLIDIISHEI